MHGYFFPQFLQPCSTEAPFKKKGKKKKDLEPAAVLNEQTASILTPWCLVEWSGFWFHKALSVTSIRLSKELLNWAAGKPAALQSTLSLSVLPLNEEVVFYPSRVLLYTYQFIRLTPLYYPTPSRFTPLPSSLGLSPLLLRCFNCLKVIDNNVITY